MFRFFALGLLVSSQVFATNGLQVLRCTEVIGPTLELRVDKKELKVISKKWNYSGSPRLIETELHAFDVEDCTFKPFSVDITCDEGKSGASLEVKLSRLSTRQGHPYNTVTMTPKNIPDMKALTFDMSRVEMGKGATCTINDVFEVI